MLAIALLVILALAPTYNRITEGSSWGNAPDGYGAWYEYMQEQGAPIERWQRPISELVEETPSAQPATLIRIVPDAASFRLFSSLTDQDDWIARGNHLILLGQPQNVSAAPFFSEIASDFGDVVIATRRRNESAATPILADSYGAVVWQEAVQADLTASPAGRSVVSTTPFLAANAYLDAPGNFAFLAELAIASGGPIWIDEYLHGYKDQDVVIEEVAGTWLGYLAKTPLLLATAQAAVVLVVVLIAQNRRPGSRQALSAVKPNNSEAYIKALAGVLQKANSQEFLVDTLVQAEQITLQKSLGLGKVPVSFAALQTAWQQTTGRSPAELNVLQIRPKGESALQTWLQRLQSLQLAVNVRIADQKIADQKTADQETDGGASRLSQTDSRTAN